MAIKILPLELDGLKQVQLTVHGDARGFFIERFHEQQFAQHNLPAHFAQDNHSRSAPGVLRGLHWQFDPPQAKLVGVTHGRIWDVAVDIRPHSPTFGRHVAMELSDLNGTLLWIPPGFAHGFCVLGDQPADLLYKVTHPYNPAGEGGIRWNDPELQIPWPLTHPTISARDSTLQSFADYRRHPTSWKP